MDYQISVLRFKLLCEEQNVAELWLNVGAKWYDIAGIYAQPNVICLKSVDKRIVLYNVKDVVLDHDTPNNEISGVIRQYDYRHNAQLKRIRFVGIAKSSHTS